MVVGSCGRSGPGRGGRKEEGRHLSGGRGGRGRGSLVMQMVMQWMWDWWRVGKVIWRVEESTAARGAADGCRRQTEGAAAVVTVAASSTAAATINCCAC